MGAANRHGSNGAGLREVDPLKQTVELTPEPGAGTPVPAVEPIRRVNPWVYVSVAVGVLFACLCSAALYALSLFAYRRSLVLSGVLQG